MAVRDMLLTEYPEMTETRLQSYMDARVHCRIQDGLVQYAFAGEDDRQYWPRLGKMRHRRRIKQYREKLRGAGKHDRAGG